MQDSEALALVAVLEAAFPSFSGGQSTTLLFANRLTNYEAIEAGRGIEWLVEHRESTAWPSWAEVARVIREQRPPVKELAEPDPDPLAAAEVDALIQRTVPGLKRMPPIADDAAVVNEKINSAKRELEKLGADA